MTIEWLGSADGGAGLVERSFVLRHAGTAVPGVLWSGAGAALRPVVLLGHGGSGHKRSERQRQLAHLLASNAELAVVAIDGPYHGDRVPAPLSPPEYQRLIVDEGIERVTDRMTSDWLATLDALAALGLVDSHNVSVCGMSMGARFGLPAAAALGPRLRCAVFGKFGLRETDLLDPGLCAPALTLTAARAVGAPVLFHVQWDDEIFPRDGQFELFSAFAAADKRLIARSGRHAETHPDDVAAWQQHIARHAAAGRQPADRPGSTER